MELMVISVYMHAQLVNNLKTNKIILRLDMCARLTNPTIEDQTSTAMD